MILFTVWSMVASVTLASSEQGKSNATPREWMSIQALVLSRALRPRPPNLMAVLSPSDVFNFQPVLQIFLDLISVLIISLGLMLVTAALKWRPDSRVHDQPPARHVDGHDLKLGKGSLEMGGAVVAIHQHITPSFLASCAWMKDEGSSHKKERKICVAWLDHVDASLTWLQFGDANDACLCVSPSLAS
jgi:hypothetical protein